MSNNNMKTEFERFYYWILTVGMEKNNIFAADLWCPLRTQ